MLILPLAMPEAGEGQDRPVKIRKHSSLIQMSNRISVTQRKAYNVLIHIARHQQRSNPQAQLFRVNLQQIKSLAGIESTNNTELKENLKALMSTVVEMNVLKKDTSIEWTATTLLSDARINNGYLEFGFSNFLSPSLLNPDMYATLDLALMRRLKSKYAIAIYELAKDYINASIPQIPIEDFRILMGLEPNQYQNGKDLRRYVIEAAIAEVNSKMDLEISFSLVTQRKKIVAIRFEARLKEVALELPCPVELEELLLKLPERLRQNKQCRLLISESYLQHGAGFVAETIASIPKADAADFQLLKAKLVAGPSLLVSEADRERFETLVSTLPPEARNVLQRRAANTVPVELSGNESALLQASIAAARELYPEQFAA